jgi:D(-)-tartrate dehydratase
MKILKILHRPVPISRYGPEVAVPPALDTSIVAIITDQRVGTEQLTGFGFTSIGRFA